jgi:DNA-binding CsgD family transcriptional regulator
MAAGTRTLTARECEVIDLLCGGASQKEAAARLNITLSNVQATLTRARLVTGSNTTVQMIARYVRQRLFQ